MERIVLLGYGGHAKSVVDSILSQGLYELAGYTDQEDKHSKELAYLGTDKNLPDIFASGVTHAVIGIGFMGKSLIRDRLYETAKGIGFEFPRIIDPTAAVAVDAMIGEGTFIGKKAVVNAGAIIGKLCIVNTGSIIEHDNRIGSFSHIAVGATLCGDVTVGEHCLVGANATVIQGVRVGDNATIGAGSVVLHDIGNHEMVAGVPAKTIRS